MTFSKFFDYFLISYFSMKVLEVILGAVYYYFQKKRFEKQYKDGTLQIVNLLDELDEDKKTWN